jgi:hypothetical protein
MFVKKVVKVAGDDRPLILMGKMVEAAGIEPGGAFTSEIDR